MACVEWVTAYIAIGSNVGDRTATIRGALVLLEDDTCQVVRVSSLMENTAIGMPPGSPPFLNGAAELKTSLSPRALLDRLLSVEQQLGRIRSNGLMTERTDDERRPHPSPRPSSTTGEGTSGWSPRTIDLDLLLYGTEQISERGLIVPHPRMREREFVMIPLSELLTLQGMPGKGLG